MSDINNEWKYILLVCFVNSIIGYGSKLTLGFQEHKPREKYTKDAGELVVSKQLVSDVVSAYGSLVHRVVYDAYAWGKSLFKIQKCKG